MGSPFLPLAEEITVFGPTPTPILEDAEGMLLCGGGGKVPPTTGRVSRVFSPAPAPTVWRLRGPRCEDPNAVTAAMASAYVEDPLAFEAGWPVA